MSKKSSKVKPVSSNKRREPVFQLLIDTCVWLDLVKDRQQQEYLDALEELVRRKIVILIVPRIVLVEFARNKARVVEESRKSLSSTLKRVKEIVEKLGDRKKKRVVLDHLNEVDHKLPTLGEHAVESVSRIEKLFRVASIIEASNDVKLRASQRAIDGRAPFHGQKNSMADAMLIEIYADILGAASGGVRSMFVTSNVKDFSATQASNKLPHPDIANYFSRIKSQYFVSLGECLCRVEPSLIADIRFENKYAEEPRKLAEILDAMDLLFHQVWYNRHCNARYRIKIGKDKLIDEVPGQPFKYRQNTVLRSVWEGALKAAARVEKKYGTENLGPWDDFEWGMINGKLSALRWILGDDWDMLDT